MRPTSRTSLEIVSSDIARGVRAAFVTLVPFYLAAALHKPELSWTAIGGWLGTLVDTGGPRARRARALVIFGLVGAVLIAGGEPLASSPLWATGALALAAFFLSLLRASGGTAGALGTFLTLVAAIATGRLRTHSIRDALYFALGAGLALFVSSIVWPVWMHLPVRRAVAGVYQEIGAYMEALAEACALRVSERDRWTALVREHHRRIRTAIEAARDAALSARARRMGETRFGGDVRALLGAAEAQFPLLSALALELETLDPDARAGAGARLAVLAAACQDVRRVLVTPEIRKRALIEKRFLPSPPESAESVAYALLDRLARAGELALDLVQDLGQGVDSRRISRFPPRPSAPPGPLRAASERPRATSLPPPEDPLGHRVRLVVDALSPRSPFFHHALRTAIAAALASWVGERLSPTRAYWVTLTTIAILQPYPGATVKRAGERVVGTIFGCVAALIIVMTVRSPLALAGLMIPLSVAAVATRPRSYRLFTFFLTPVFVLLAERFTGDWWAAAARAGDAVLGGAVALFVGAWLVPSSERGRLPDALGAMFDAVAAYAAAVLETLDPSPTNTRVDRVMMARRASGIALGETEALLERYLAEPLRDRAHAASAMLLATYARRLGAAVTSVDTLADTLDFPDAEARAAFAANVREAAKYVASVLADAKVFARDMAVAVPLQPPPRLPLDGQGPEDDALERLVRWTALVASVASGANEESASPAEPARASWQAGQN